MQHTSKLLMPQVQSFSVLPGTTCTYLWVCKGNMTWKLAELFCAHMTWEATEVVCMFTSKSLNTSNPCSQVHSLKAWPPLKVIRICQGQSFQYIIWLFILWQTSKLSNQWHLNLFLFLWSDPASWEHSSAVNNPYQDGRHLYTICHVN